MTPGLCEEKAISVFNDIKAEGYLLDCLVLNAANLGIRQEFLTVSIPEFMDVINVNADFEDIANAAYYFGREDSKNTTGAELVVDGGNMIQLYPIVPEGK